MTFRKLEHKMIDRKRVKRLSYLSKYAIAIYMHVDGFQANR